MCILADKEPVREYEIRGGMSDEKDERKPARTQEHQLAHHGGIPVCAGETYVLITVGPWIRKKLVSVISECSAEELNSYSVLVSELCVVLLTGSFVSTWVKYYCIYHREPKRMTLLLFDQKSGGKIVSVSDILSLS